jgi:hypothetical protein
MKTKKEEQPITNTERVVANIDAAYQRQLNRPEYGLIDKDAGTAITMPSPSLDPRIISNIDGYNDETKGYVQPALDAFETCHNGIQHVCDARRKVAQNTAWSEERRLIEIAKLADARQMAAAKAFDGARKRLEQGITALDESLNRPLTQDANAGSINGEVREHLKNLSREERQRLLDGASQTQDLLTLRAVLSGPGYLSGISEDERKLRVNAFHRMTQPQIAQRADVMRKALELIDTRAGLLFEQFERAMGGTGSRAKVAQARQRHLAAEDALKIS